MDQEKIGARCNEIEHDALPLRRLARQGIVAGQTAGLEVARSGSAMSTLGQKQTLKRIRTIVRGSIKSQAPITAPAGQVFWRSHAQMF